MQEQGWFDVPANSVGALCARLATDCAAVQGATGTRLGTMLQGISTMVLGVGLAMIYSWKMTLVSLLSVPFVSNHCGPCQASTMRDYYLVCLLHSEICCIYLKICGKNDTVIYSHPSFGTLFFLT